MKCAQTVICTTYTATLLRLSWCQVYLVPLSCITCYLRNLDVNHLSALLFSFSTILFIELNSLQKLSVNLAHRFSNITLSRTSRCGSFSIGQELYTCRNVFSLNLLEELIINSHKKSLAPPPTAKLFSVRNKSYFTYELYPILMLIA